MAQVTVDVLANVTQATKSLNQLQGSVSSAFSKINATVAAFAGVFTATVAGISLKHLTDEASEAQTAMLKLEAALKLAGDFSPTANRRFLELADSLAELTGVQDEAIVSAFSLAKQYNATNEEAEALVKAALDLSAATGTDLNTAVEQIGKTLDGTAGRLNEIVPQLRTLTVEQLKAGEAIRVVGDRFRGVSEAIGNTFQGSINRTKVSFSNLLESIGDIIITNPLVIKFIQSVQSFLGNLEKTVIANKAAINDFVSNGVLLLVDALSFLIKSFAVLDKLLVSFKNGIDIIVTPLVALVAIIDNVRRGKVSIEDLKTTLQGVGKQTVDSVLGREQEFEKRLEYYTKINDKVDDLRKSLEGAAKNQKQLQTGIENAANSTSSNRKNQKSQAEIDKEREAREKAEKEFRDRVVSTVSGVVGSIGKGSAGVADAFSQVASFFTDTIMPGFGAIAGQVISILAQGPEAAGKFVREFIAGIPQIIENIILAIPEVILAFVDGLDQFFERLSEKLPIIIEKLVQALPRVFTVLQTQMPLIATRFAVALVAQAPYIAIESAKAFIREIPRIAVEMGKELGKTISSVLNPIKGGGLGGAAVGGAILGPIGAIIGGLGFAQGGLVPAGYPNDTFPARLSSGEMVIDRSQNERINRFLDSVEAGGLKSSQPVVVQLQLGQKQLAEVLLDINKQGFRTA